MPRPKETSKTTHLEGVSIIQSVLSPQGMPVIGLYLHTANGYLTRSIAGVKQFRSIQPHLLGAPSILSVRPGISQSQLADYLGGGRAKAGLQVAACIQLGWVRRVVADGDRRKYTLHLTAKGAQMLRDVVRIIEEHERLLTAKLSSAEKIALKNLLVKLMSP